MIIKKKRFLKRTKERFIEYNIKTKTFKLLEKFAHLHTISRRIEKYCKCTLLLQQNLFFYLFLYIYLYIPLNDMKNAIFYYDDVSIPKSQFIHSHTPSHI